MDEHMEGYDFDMNQLEQEAATEAQNMQMPDWARWAAYCRSIDIWHPSVGDNTIFRVAKSHFPKLTQQGFSSMFGAPWQVYQTLYRRYFYQLVWFSVEPRDILWAYNRLATNLSFNSLATIWNVPRSTIASRVKFTLTVLSIVLDEVSWRKKRHQPAEFFPRSGPFNRCAWIVSSVEYPIGDSTIKYEVACHISSGRILHFAGGVDGDVSDRELLQLGGLWQIAPENERGIADSSYTSDEWNHRLFTPLPPLRQPNGSNTLTEEEDVYNALLFSLKLEIGRLFERFNNYSFLLRCRDPSQRAHSEAFAVIANTINILLEVHPLRDNVSRWILNPPALLLPPRVLERMPNLVQKIEDANGVSYFF